MALTKVTGHVVKPDTNIQFHNTKSTGIVTFTHTSNATSSTTGALQITGGVGIVKDLHVGGNVTVGGTLTYDDVTNIDSLGIITARGGINVSGGNVTITNDLDVDGHTELDNLSVAGIATFRNELTVTPSNASSYSTHLNFQNNGSNFISCANGGATYFRNSSSGGTAMSIQGSNKAVDIDSALRHLGDTDTLLQFGTNTISLFTANVERTRTTEVGRVGIGTTNPVAHLEVAAYQNVEVLRLRDRHFNKYLTIRGGGTPNRMVIDSYEGGGGGAAIDLASNGDTKVRIGSDGKVGIGTDAAGSQLSVGRASGNSGLTLDCYGVNRSRLIFRNSVVRGTQTNIEAHNDDLRLVVNSGNRLNITSAGYVGVGITNPGGLFTVSGNPAEVRIQHAGNSSFSKIISDSSNELNIYTGGGPHLAMTIDGSQNVGIGEGTNVTQKLHVREDNNSQHYIAYLQNRYSGTHSSSLIAMSCGTVDFGDNRYAYMGAKISGVNENGTNLIFATNPNGGSASERLRIDSGGSVSIGDAATHTYSAHSEGDDLVIGGAGWRGMTIYGEGGGGVIQFADAAGNRDGQIMYSHGDRQFMFRTAGNVDRLIIDSKGNIKSGTTGSALNFTDSNSGNTKSIEVGASSGGDALLVTHSSGYGVGYFGYEAGGDRLVIACDNGSGNNKIDFITDAGTTTGGGTDNLNAKVPKMRITADGKVMIGTTNSSARLLNVKGSLGVLSPSQTTALDFESSDGQNAYISAYHASGTNLYIRTNYSGVGVQNRVHIYGNGQFDTFGTSAGNPLGITITNQNTANYSHARLRLVSQNGASASNIYTDHPNTALRLEYNSSNSVYIKENGYVGITTSSPGSALHVRGAGGIRIDPLAETNIVSNANVVTDGGGNPYLSGTPWYHTSTYAWDTNNSPNMDYYWIKIVESFGYSTIAYVEYLCHSDSNYPRSVHGRIDFAKYGPHSLSISHWTTSPSTGVTPQVVIDSNKRVWIRMNGAQWNSDFRFRLIYGESINLNSDFTIGTDNNSAATGRMLDQDASPLNASGIVESGATLRWDLGNANPPKYWDGSNSSTTAGTYGDSAQTYGSGQHRFVRIGTRGRVDIKAGHQDHGLLVESNYIGSGNAAQPVLASFKSQKTTVAEFNRMHNTGVILDFKYNGSSVGSISVNSSSVPSDRNFKTNISNLNLGLSFVNKLKPSQFNYKIDEPNTPVMYGLIAQELEESLTSEGVSENSTQLLQHHPTDDTESDYDVDYGRLTPILINAIKELSTEIDKLKAEIAALKSS